MKKLLIIIFIIFILGCPVDTGDSDPINIYPPDSLKIDISEGSNEVKISWEGDLTYKYNIYIEDKDKIKLLTKESIKDHIFIQSEGIIFDTAVKYGVSTVYDEEESNIGWSDPVTISSSGNEPLLPPDSLKIDISEDSDEVKISWKGDLTYKYNVYIEDKGSITLLTNKPIKDHSFVQSEGIIFDTAVKYGVSTIYNGEESVIAWSNPVTILSNGVEPLLPPNSLEVDVSKDYDEIYISWEGDLTYKYNVYIEDKGSIKLLTIESIKENSFVQLEGIVFDRAVKYGVSTINGEIESEIKWSESINIQPNTLTVSNLKVSTLTNESGITLSWSDYGINTSEIKTYHIYRSINKDSDFTFIAELTKDKVFLDQPTDQNILLSETIYFYKVYWSTNNDVINGKSIDPTPGFFVSGVKDIGEPLNNSDTTTQVIMDKNTEYAGYLFKKDDVKLKDIDWIKINIPAKHTCFYEIKFENTTNTEGVLRIQGQTDEYDFSGRIARTISFRNNTEIMKTFSFSVQLKSSGENFLEKYIFSKK